MNWKRIESPVALGSISYMVLAMIIFLCVGIERWDVLPLEIPKQSKIYPEYVPKEFNVRLGPTFLTINIPPHELDAAVECLAQNIYFEASNQNLKGKIAVAIVPVKRLNKSKKAIKLCGVIWKKKQFSWTHDGKSDTPANRRMYGVALRVASAVLSNESSIPDFTGGATHYHAVYVDPYWNEYYIKTVVIGDHIFYR